MHSKVRSSGHPVNFQLYAELAGQVDKATLLVFYGRG